MWGKGKGEGQQPPPRYTPYLGPNSHMGLFCLNACVCVCVCVFVTSSFLALVPAKTKPASSGSVERYYGKLFLAVLDYYFLCQMIQRVTKKHYLIKYIECTFYRRVHIESRFSKDW